MFFCSLGFIENLCSLKTCKYGSSCFEGKCICPKESDCPPDPRSVCGTDGRTYKNQCHLDVTSCKKQMLIETVKTGACGKTELSSDINLHSFYHHSVIFLFDECFFY